MYRAGATTSAKESLDVVIAPDSFKGSAGAGDVAQAIAAGWRSARPADRLTLLPQADGGEGTLAAVAAAHPDTAIWHVAGPVCGPDRRPVSARWLQLPDSVAAVELAESSGLPLMRELAPTRATSRGLGQVIRAALESGADRLVIAVGGSASTDGGVGVLLELGLRLYDANDRRIDVVDVLDLESVARVDASALRPPPPGGVEVLTDTVAPLCGPHGAAHVFGEQKGADSATRHALDHAIKRFADLTASQFGISAATPGAGAAGGVGFGLLAWGASLVSGARRIIELTGLTAAIPTADLVITGEGRFDASSTTGKLVGSVLEQSAAQGVRTLVLAGQLAVAAPDVGVALTDVAESTAAAVAAPLTYARLAARLAAERLSIPDAPTPSSATTPRQGTVT